MIGTIVWINIIASEAHLKNGSNSCCPAETGDFVYISNTICLHINFIQFDLKYK